MILRGLLSLLLVCQAANGLAADPPASLAYLDACRIALEKNPTIRSALAEIQVAAGNRTALRSVAFPDLFLSLPGGYQGPRSSADGRFFGIILADFSQPLFDLRIPFSFKAGDLGVLVAVHNYWATVNTVLYSIRNAYLAARFEEDFLVINGRNVSANEAVFSELSLREASGIGRDTERQRAGLLLEKSRSENLTPPFLRKVALLEIAALMGWELAPNSQWLDQVRLSDDLTLSAANVDFASAVAEAKTNRSDIALLRTLAKQNDALAVVTLSAMLPIISFDINLQSIPSESAANDSTLINTSTGTTGLDSVPTTSDIRNDEFQTSVRFGPVATWRAFDGFAALGGYRATSARAKADNIRAEALAQRVEIEVRIVQSQLRSADRLLKLSGSSVATAQNTVDASRETLAAPELDRTLSQFAFAQDDKNALDLRLIELRARYERGRALATLDFVTGRNFRLRFVEPPASKLPPNQESYLP